MTGIQVATDVLKLLGATSQGELPTAEEAQDVLVRLNRMIDMWNAETLKQFEVRRTVHTLTSAQQEYEIGPTAADFVQARPEWFDHMGIIQQQNTNQPIELPLKILTTKDWANEVPVKNITSALPTKVYVDGAFPNRTMSFWPLPNDSTLQIAVYYIVPLTTWSVLTTNLAFPPGYDETIIYNLALRLAPEFGRKLAPEIVQIAMDGLLILERANNQAHFEELAVDAALSPGKQFDWRTGDPQ